MRTSFESMKSLVSKRLWFYILFHILNIGYILAQPMSGNYTLDSASASSTVNYQNWSAFRNALVSNGVNGRVTLDVITDITEANQIHFPSISGVNASRQIIIKGNGHVLQASVADAVVLLTGADYMVFDSLIVRNISSSESAIGMRLSNGSDYNTISNCRIELDNCINPSLTSGAFIALSSNSLNIQTTNATLPGSYNRIVNNVMETLNANSPGPGYGIVINGILNGYTNAAQNNTIRENRILNFYYTAILMNFTNGNEVVRNEICRDNAGKSNSNSILYGIKMEKTYSSNRSTRIDSNYMHTWPCDTAKSIYGLYEAYGIYGNLCKGNASFRFSVRGNTIHSIKATKALALTYLTLPAYLDLNSNAGLNCDIISSPDNSMFSGFYTSNCAGSYRINSNRVVDCDGGTTWYGIANFSPEKALGVQEINDNQIVNNLNGIYMKYGIYNYLAQFSDSTYPVIMRRNIIRNNENIQGAVYAIYCYYYGSYSIEDNRIELNGVSEGNSFYGIFAAYYGDYRIKRNIIKDNYSKNGGSTAYSMYIYFNRNLEISSNLIIGNYAGMATYGIYELESSMNIHTFKILQNTIILDGNKSSSSNSYLYPLFINSNNQKIVLRGNLFEIRNAYLSYFGFQSSSKPNCSQNTFYLSSISNSYWYAGSFGTAFSDTGFIRIVEGSGNEIAENGHYFTSTFASPIFKNQNNVLSDSSNLTDVYGAERNPIQSDRGAVEYSGLSSTNVQNILNEIKVYPNPLSSKTLTITNPHPETEYQIFDSNGKLLLRGVLSTGENTIGFNSLPSGIYSLIVNGISEIHKIVVR